jgi:CheY-like chemotaxis protein
MNAIIGFAGFLLEHDLSEIKKNEYSRIIRERTYDLLRIVEDILDISKIEVGQMKIIESDVKLESIMNEIYEYYRLKLPWPESEAVLALKLSLAGNLKNAMVQIDGQRLKQILNNLLDNAFKFTKKGYIEFGCQIMSDNELLFFVKDTGIGIREDKRDIIFDRFRQADDLLTSRQYGGTGLGLSIVKGLVTLMNGKIWLESQVDAGSTFYFTLPLKLLTKNNEYMTGNNVKHLLSWGNKVVLIVEDDPSNAAYLREALAGKGLQILVAYTGEEALRLFRNNPNINLVLMDIRLPDINGLNLTRIIRKNNPNQVVIAQTAYASSSDMQECMEAGCDDYLAKPINYQNLISVMDYYLKKG